jgi:hypothetical protein
MGAKVPLVVGMTLRELNGRTAIWLTGDYAADMKRLPKFTRPLPLISGERHDRS